MGRERKPRDSRNGAVHFGQKEIIFFKKRSILKVYVLRITLNCILFLKTQKNIGKNVGGRVLTKCA